MKHFFSTALGAFVGTIVGLLVMSVLSVVFTMIGIIGLSGSLTMKEDVALVENSILQIKLDGIIPERESTGSDIMAVIGPEKEVTTLSTIIKAIKVAANDKHIKGIFLNCQGGQAGLAGSYELRNALQEYKKSGKWIYAYGDNYAQSDYYIASVADSIFINPQGILDLHGLATGIPYYKTLLDKVGIEMQVFKVGTFKSAVEPYILTKMSDANKLQTSQFLGDMWQTIISQISKSRNISTSSLNNLVDSITLTRPVEYLKKKKFVDAECYAFNFIRKLKHLTSIDEKDNLNFINPLQLAKYDKPVSSKDKIAVLFANGEINSASDDGIVAKTMIEKIMSAAEDDDIKALVMRVNSPGGSAFDSEQIWAALEDFKKSGKPFAVSMGNYAASGGYYISCGANRIFAEPTTLTGSIGIFGMIPNLQKLVNNVGINIEEVATNPNANFPSIMRPITPLQAQQMQNMINRGYDLFTTRCANGRHMSIDSLRMIAEGRVWDGSTALKLGLVDQIGNLDDAINWVAQKAKTSKYELVELPEPQDALTRFMNRYFNEFMSKMTFTKYDYLIDQKKSIMRLLNLYPVQARTDITVEL